MGTFQLGKRMVRYLTDEEKEKVYQYIRENKKATIQEIADHFETLFKMPITETCITTRMVEMILNDEEVEQLPQVE